MVEVMEMKKQMEVLHAVGCDYIQRNLIGRPIDSDIFDKVHHQPIKDGVMTNV